MTECKFELSEAFADWYYELMGEEVCLEEEAFYGVINYTDFLIDKLIRLEKEVERLKEILADDEEEGEEGAFE